MPLACFHRTGDPSLKNRFYGRFPLENATALTYFSKKGITQELLHNLKYRGHQELSHFFGKWLGAELAQLPEYQNVEMVIPVPLHRKRLLKRGYNQVSGFGKELAVSLGIPFREDILVKELAASTQVFKKRVNRFNDQNNFSLRYPDAISKRHLLLVDDITTTGATLEQCALALLKAPEVKLSIATIAVA